MNKYSTLLLAGAVALSFASCKNNGPAPENNSQAMTTNAAVSVATIQSATRAFGDGQDRDVAPVDQEGTVTDAILFGSKTGITNLEQQSYTSGTWVSKVFETTARTEAMTILLNAKDGGFVTLPSEFNGDIIVTMDKFADLANNSTTGGGFVMTGKADPTATKEVKDNIAEGDVTSTNGESKNYFTLSDLERVVAKAQVHLPTGKTEVTVTDVNTLTGGSMTSFKWSIQGMAKKSYLFTNNAGDRFMTDTDTDATKENYEYANGYKSVVDAENAIPFDQTIYNTTVKSDPNFISAGDYREGVSGKNMFGETKPAWADHYAPKDLLAARTEDIGTGDNITDKNGKSISGGMFFLETSHAGSDLGLNYNRVAHAIIYANTTIAADGTMIGKKTNWNLSEAIDFTTAGKWVKTIPGDTDKDGTIEAGETLLQYIPEKDRIGAPADMVASADGDFSGARQYWVEAPLSFIKTLDDSYFGTTGSKVKHVTFAVTVGSSAANASIADVTDKATLATSEDATKEVYLLQVNDDANTFYVANVSGKATIFSTLLSARVMMGKGNDILKFKSGKVVYITPLNAQGEAGNVYTMDTRRNNIYDLSINSITGLGFNYNPVFPEDPEAPRPGDNPDEPEPDPNTPPVNETKTHMSVTAKVLNWNYVERTVDFGGGSGI